MFDDTIFELPVPYTKLLPYNNRQGLKIPKVKLKLKSKAKLEIEIESESTTWQQKSEKVCNRIQ